MTGLRAFKLDPAQFIITEEEILADLTYPVREGARR
jgi:hypothetical protein